MKPELLMLFIGSYFLGSIPFGVLVAKRAGIDITSVGSGNIGATNVMRTLGRGPGLMVFALDVAKGLLPALAARAIAPGQQDIWFYGGLAAILGHVFSPFLKFKGGKGIATSLGALLGSTPLTAISAFTVFALVTAVGRTISLGSIVAAVVAPIFAWIFKDEPAVIVGLTVMGLFIIWKHRANIERLKNGTESKFTFGKSEGNAQEEPRKNA
jgi:glycerol-3-phosphate acyltransferase PlsY